MFNAFDDRKKCYNFNIKFVSLKATLGKPAKKKNSENNEFGFGPTINSEKSNSENWSQSIYPPSLEK